MLTAAKWSVAGALILPQSILLGATFPLMSAGVLRLAPRQPGRTLAALYFANSLGAAAGVLVAGFWLIALAGLPGTLVAAASLNLVVAVGTVLIVVRARQSGADETAPAVPAPDASTRPPAADAALVRLLLFASCATAIASFIYEIGWIRMLALVLGSATHSFELMLSAFILGLALGAWWIRSRADRLADPIRTLGIVQWTMGCLALATLPLYLESFDWLSVLLRTFARTDAGYTGFTIARYGICLMVMCRDFAPHDAAAHHPDPSPETAPARRSRRRPGQTPRPAFLEPLANCSKFGGRTPAVPSWNRIPFPQQTGNQRQPE